LPITKNEAGLAVVMGHEIGHAIAQHGAERISEGLLMTAGAITLNEAMRNKPQQTQKLAMAALGLGGQVGISLPFSRFQESEADHIGLIYMAKAGYDPREAVAFWKRMEESSKGKQPNEFLSTHPSHETRVTQLEKWMPEALKAYDASPYRTQN